MSLDVGSTHTANFVVEPRHTAVFLGSGDLDVLGTPALIAFLEMTCRDAVRSAIGEDSTSVGTHMELDHLKASKIGAHITCFSEVTAREGRRIDFTIRAESDGILIAQGKHTRAIVDRERFLAGLNK